MGRSVRTITRCCSDASIKVPNTLHLRSLALLTHLPTPHHSHPQVGELIGGSQREDNYEVLERRVSRSVTYILHSPSLTLSPTLPCSHPQVGELIGGSQREDNYEVLERRIKEGGMDVASYEGYLDLRKYGSVPHSGFGLGFERLILFATGLENIREVIPFPRWPGNAMY